MSSIALIPQSGCVPGSSILSIPPAERTAAQIPRHEPMHLSACRDGWRADQTKRKCRAESDRRGGLEGRLAARRLPATVHAAVIAAPATTVMAIPVMVIPTVMIPIDRRHLALVGGNRAAERRNRRLAKRPKGPTSASLRPPSQRQSVSFSFSLYFSSGANLCERITRKT